MDRIKSKVRIVRGCWIWVGTYSNTNPIIRLKNPRRLYSARRHSYETWNGVTIPRTHVVAATCKDSRCVNPAHLVALIRGSHAHRLRFGLRQPTHCQRGHEWSEWNTGRQQKGARICLACDRENRRRNTAKRRAENPGHEKVLRQARVATARELVEICKRSACIRCGENNPACLDFHHRNPIEKDRSIASVFRVWGVERIYAEIQKCDILCSNCHRKLHWEERQKELTE